MNPRIRVGREGVSSPGAGRHHISAEDNRYARQTGGCDLHPARGIETRLSDGNSSRAWFDKKRPESLWRLVVDHLLVVFREPGKGSYVDIHGIYGNQIHQKAGQITIVL